MWLKMYIHVQRLFKNTLVYFESGQYDLGLFRHKMKVSTQFAIWIWASPKDWILHCVTLKGNNYSQDVFIHIKHCFCMTWFKLSQSKTKPPKWPVHPAKTMMIRLGGSQRRHRSTWVSDQSDQSSLSAWRSFRAMAILWVHSEDSDQTGQMPRLMWVFAGCTPMILSVLSCFSSMNSHLFISYLYILKIENKWSSSWDYGTYHIGDQRRFSRACASTQSRQSLRCSPTWSMEVDEGSHQKSDI